MHQMLPGSRLLNVSSEHLKTSVSCISTDSRKIKAGDFFIAIDGEKFDGNLFIQDVSNKGAFAALVSKEQCVPTNYPALLVEDTLRAIQTMAAAWRQVINPQLILVTGSNGKTTVKEMIASILREALGQDNVLATPGNLNNEIGLPLTLLGLRSHHQMAVIELGMNHPGETKFLAKIAQPNITLINNAQREHQEFMHTVEAVAREHAEAMGQLSSAGVAVFPADSEYTHLWQEASIHHTFIDFALCSAGHSAGKVYGTWKKPGVLQIQFPEAEIQVQLATLGDHNAKNAIAAASVAQALKINPEFIRLGLEKFIPVTGRMQSHHLPSFEALGQLVDDTYNANPDSVIAAIDVLAQLPGTRWLILGDMGEVGDRGPEFHAEIGRYAKDKGIEYMYATGDLSVHTVSGFQGHHMEQSQAQSIYFQEPKALLKKLKEDLEASKNRSSTERVAVLVKGSRFTKMERIVHCLLKEESLCF
jgi:UDP-N-acetylmuramoyl-tripeptide--D-alanyl-D-alanine ligase